MNKKVVAVALSVMLLLSGCTFSALAEKSADAAGEPITIEFWNGYIGPDGDVLEEIVNRFNEVNKFNITIVLDRDTNMSTKLMTAFAANTAPTLITMSMMDMANYVVQGNLRPISDIWDKTNLNHDDFVKNVLDAGTYRGEQYLLPIQINSRYLFWNKTLLAKAGYDPNVAPKTWEELKEMSLAMTDAANGVYGGTIPYDNCGAVMSMMIDYGGSVMKEENGEVYSDIYSPESVKALELWKSMLDNGSSLCLNITDSQTMMRAGTLGFTVSYPSLSVDLGDYIDYGVSVMPAGPVDQVNDFALTGFAITKNASDAEMQAAYHFLEYWNNTSPETALDEPDQIPVIRWSLDCGYPPYLNSVRENEEIANTQPLATFCQYADFAKDIYPDEFTGIGFLVNSVFTPMLEEIAYGDASAIDATLLKYHDIFNTWKEHVATK